MKTIENELKEFYQAWYYDLHPNMQPVFKEQLLSLLKSAAKAQRKDDKKLFKEGMDVRMSLLIKGTLMGMDETPLVTDKS